MGGGLANADATVNYACKRPYFADTGGGESKLVKIYRRPLWLAPKIENIFYVLLSSTLIYFTYIVVLLFNPHLNNNIYHFLT